jgi:hypothetical protein
MAESRADIEAEIERLRRTEREIEAMLAKSTTDYACQNFAEALNNVRFAIHCLKRQGRSS